MKIMVFLHGTAIMHKHALGVTREERVKQVMDGDETLHEFASYVPVGDAVQKLQAWERQGAEIVYLSSHKTTSRVEIDQEVLRKYRFPDGQVYFRQRGESYAQVAESVSPDILIEDDCESIGGETEMTYPHLRPEFKTRIKSVVVREFGGIDHLPDDIHALIKL
jgi:hypothetical protein